MSQSHNSAVAVIGIDIGKNSFHVVGLDDRGAIVLRQKWSRGQIEAARRRLHNPQTRDERTSHGINESNRVREE
jgi:hypothetical protein